MVAAVGGMTIRADHSPSLPSGIENPDGAFGSLAGSRKEKPMEPEEERAAAELRKLRAEAVKLEAEARKLEPEALKLRREATKLRAEVRRFRQSTIVDFAKLGLALFALGIAALEWAEGMGWL